MYILYKLTFKGENMLSVKQHEQIDEGLIGIASINLLDSTDDESTNLTVMRKIFEYFVKPGGELSYCSTHGEKYYRETVSGKGENSFIARQRRNYDKTKQLSPRNVWDIDPEIYVKLRDIVASTDNKCEYDSIIHVHMMSNSSDDADIPIKVLKFKDIDFNINEAVLKTFGNSTKKEVFNYILKKSEIINDIKINTKLIYQDINNTILEISTDSRKFGSTKEGFNFLDNFVKTLDLNYSDNWSRIETAETKYALNF